MFNINWIIRNTKISLLPPKNLLLKRKYKYQKNKKIEKRMKHIIFPSVYFSNF